jgi:predicted phosphate transport protein (TIGR00153 family)
MKKYDYYRYFVSMMDSATTAARMLEENLRNFNAENIEKIIKDFHEIEHDADLKKHDMMDMLLKEFLPPIDREDIVKLAHELDEITDLTEDVMLYIYMFNVKTIRDDAFKVAEVLVKCCSELSDLLKELEKSRKNDLMKEKIIEVNRLEEVADELYIKAMRRLYTCGASPVEIVVWNDIYKSLENCCDACEHVADTIEEIILKK